MKRFNIEELEPKAMEALIGVEKYIAKARINHKIVELIKLRSSILNGCPSCTKAHIEKAQRAGLSEEQIEHISKWQDSPLFDDQQKAILKMTEEVCLIHLQGLTNETYAAMQAHFSDNQIVQLLMVVCSINSFNRLGIAALQQ